MDRVMAGRWVGVVLCLGGLPVVLGLVVMLAGLLSPPEVSKAAPAGPRPPLSRASAWPESEQKGVV